MTFLLTTGIKNEESLQVVRLEQTVLEKRVDNKAFFVPRLNYSITYISWT
jgi:hypothetical protein